MFSEPILHFKGVFQTSICVLCKCSYFWFGTHCSQFFLVFTGENGGVWLLASASSSLSMMNWGSWSSESSQEVWL